MTKQAENILEKIFNTIKNSSNGDETKEYATSHLLTILGEYDDYVLYILRNVYELLMSKSRINRICGARILGGMDASVRYRGKYSNETDLNSDKIYLSTRDFKVEKTGKAPSKIAEIQRELSMEYVDKGILEDEEKQKKFKAFKTSTVEDKEIESVGDFYANLKEMTLSAEWHRRHGAFIGLGNLKIEKEIGSGSGIVVEMDAGEMIGRCFVILKNDKFNDYVDNKAVAPVREAVGEYLCKLAEHEISAENLVEQLFKLLGDACWHVQYGALHAIHLCIKNQIKHIVHKTETNKELFIALIRSKDEDIKCVAADILSQIVEQLSVDEIARIGRSAIDQFKVEDALNTAHSKSQLLNLLVCIICINDTNKKKSAIEVVKKGDLVGLLFSCCTSTISEIRTASVRICQVIDTVDVVYLLSEHALFNYSSDFTKANSPISSAEFNEILQTKIARLPPADLVDYLKHVFKVATGDIFSHYDKNDFVCYDENYFTRDGWKVVGSTDIMNNRIFLLQGILGVLKETSVSDESLIPTRNLQGLLIKTLVENDHSSRIFISGQSLKDDFKHIPSLQPLSITDFAALINQRNCLDYAKTNSSTIIHFAEYIRLCVARNTHNNFDFSIFYCLEYSREMVKLISGAITDQNNFSKLFDCLIKKAIENIKAKEENALLTANTAIFIEVVKERRPAFFSEETAAAIFAVTDFPLLFARLGRLFVEFSPAQALFDSALCYSQKEQPERILRHFLRSGLRYGALYVRHVLESGDISTLPALIEFLDPSFAVPLLRLVLRDISPETSAILGRIINFLALGINDQIADVDPDLYQRIVADYEDAAVFIDPERVRLFPISATHFRDGLSLRPYQEDGVRWIGFLFKFNLGGILADDMGLGKTVQVLAYLATVEAKDVIIACPGSLCAHWADEIQTKFDFGETVILFDSLESSLKRKSAKQPTIFRILSYSFIRRCNSDISAQFVIFDEGHLLRNRKTLLHQRASRITASHRLILTGTPVHNSVDDLFSLFNLIMPGYLGDDKEFGRMYRIRMSGSKTATNEYKNDSKLITRMAGLHKKVLPFIMRRLKKDVLADLPDKIISDLVVEMNEEQKKIYRGVETGQNDDVSTIVRNNLLLKAASHPGHFDSTATSSKTEALLDIIHGCGGPGNMRNKLIIFFQSKKTVALVLNELLNVFQKGDIRVLSPEYYEINQSRDIGRIAHDFNNSGAAVLLSTTQAGGVGLNLCSANLVVFYEHDWNPFNDLQAMDRAHRIGQKQAVNVMRLVTRDTIEEKVMCYQRFKEYVSGNIITQQNTKIESMGIEEALEGFKKE